MAPKFFLMLESKTSLVSNSERRDIFHETDEEIGLKVKKAHEAGLIVIVCLNKRKIDRDAGKTNNIIFAQNQTCCSQTQQIGNALSLVIVYEPVCAIGT
ncbi:MAG: hypothetical protein EZS28_010285 [Streblomastix strix]|uniref:Triosephosphate isomerase n=1 Tax=Streblomastix strix TaxID=222440 RepID=A0A5J4WIL0_9EUKA|nr:MAG: hypothetical protein EZS28_010285 [Streblomastix strix]